MSRSGSMSEFGGGARRLSGMAARLLGWSPAEFWAATPAELSDALMPADAGGEPPTPGAIAALIELYPDEQG